MERGGGHSLQMLSSCHLMLHVVYTPFFSLPVCQGVWLVYMNNHIFSSIQQTCAPSLGMKQCSSVQSDGWQSIFSELAGSVTGLAALAAHSCMGLGKHGLTHWDPRSTGLANELIDHWQVHKKLPPHLAYILWNCSGVDVNNLEAILVMTWHRQGAFQIQYGIF